MNKKLQAFQITANGNGLSVVFVETDKEGKPLQKGVRLVVNYPDSKELSKFEQGAEYTITIMKSK